MVLQTTQLSRSAQDLSHYKQRFLIESAQDQSLIGKIKLNLVGRILTLAVSLYLHAEAVCSVVRICFMLIRKVFSQSNEELLNQQRERCSVAYHQSLSLFFSIFRKIVIPHPAPPVVAAGAPPPLLQQQSILSQTVQPRVPSPPAQPALSPPSVAISPPQEESAPRSVSVACSEPLSLSHVEPGYSLPPPAELEADSALSEWMRKQNAHRLTPPASEPSSFVEIGVGDSSLQRLSALGGELSVVSLSMAPSQPGLHVSNAKQPPPQSDQSSSPSPVAASPTHEALAAAPIDVPLNADEFRFERGLLSQRNHRNWQMQEMAMERGPLISSCFFSPPDSEPPALLARPFPVKIGQQDFIFKSFGLFHPIADAQAARFLEENFCRMFTQQIVQENPQKLSLDTLKPIIERTFAELSTDPSIKNSRGAYAALGIMIEGCPELWISFLGQNLGALVISETTVQTYQAGRAFAPKGPFKPFRQSEPLIPPDVNRIQLPYDNYLLFGTGDFLSRQGVQLVKSLFITEALSPSLTLQEMTHGFVHTLMIKQKGGEPVPEACMLLKFPPRPQGVVKQAFDALRNLFT